MNLPHDAQIIKDVANQLILQFDPVATVRDVVYGYALVGTLDPVLFDGFLANYNHVNHISLGASLPLTLKELIKYTETLSAASIDLKQQPR